METKSSLRAVNLLFLGMLCLELANAFFAWMPQYVRLILNEALFVFLPAYLYLRFTRQPIRERVRWRWPGWKVALLSLLIGAGLFVRSLAEVRGLRLGYDVDPVLYIQLNTRGGGLDRAVMIVMAMVRLVMGVMCMRRAMAVIVMPVRMIHLVAAGIAAMCTDERDDACNQRADQGQENNRLNHNLVSPSSG